MGGCAICKKTPGIIKPKLTQSDKSNLINNQNLDNINSSQSK